MGKISEVLYKEIPETILTNEKAGEYYFHLNAIRLDPMFYEEYEKYEEEHIAVRNAIIRNAVCLEEIDKHPKMNTTIFGISAINNNPIIVVEI